jgi:nucleoid-associated protein YgaU
MPELIKAEFVRLDKKGHAEFPAVEVQFNPTEFTLSKGAQTAEIGIPGLDSPVLQFIRGQAETLTVDLFFDTTDSGMAGDSVESVTQKTDQFYQLIKIDRKSHAPAVLRFTWGAKSNFPGAHLTSRWYSQRRSNGFTCIVESVRQRFTLFSPEGVALRATLTVTLKEYKTLKQQVKELGLESPDRTHTHILRTGDTISTLAEEYFDDPREWRAIAEHNRIEDPLDLNAGDILEIPPLR